MAYSSIAHSGYMLVAVTALCAGGAMRPISADGTLGSASMLASGGEWGGQAIAGVLFYLTAYGIMNTGVFAVLMMLPSRRRVTDADGNVRRLPATSAETYDDIAGTGRRYPALAIAMGVCCISLIGIPLTVGFLGKLYILWPAFELARDQNITDSGRHAMWWLIGLTVLNAAIAAAYYLRIIASMVLSPSVEEEDALAEGREYTPEAPPRQPLPFVIATSLSVAGVLLFGMILPATNLLNTQASQASSAIINAPRQLAPAPAESPRTPARAAAANDH
jgi:NADH:ubiquinone oxidoreductase subunit 2 (subunit N)